MSDPLLFVDTSESNVTVTGNLHVTNHVGIGTDSPDRLLEVYTGDGTVPGIRLRRGAGSAYTDLHHVGVNVPSSGDLEGLAIITSDGNATTQEVMRICGNGNVGVGTNAPDVKLHVGGGDVGIDRDQKFDFGAGYSSNWYIKQKSADNKLYFERTGGSGNEIVIDTTGNVGIGTASPNEKLEAHGNIRAGGSSYLNGYVTMNNGGSIFRNYSGSGAGLHFTGGAVIPADATGGDHTGSHTKLGHSSYRWGQIYSTSSTISTSDRNEKQDINEITESERKVASKIVDLFRTFRMKDAVSKKGDEARLHNGVIAQDLIEVFQSEGLDAHRYGLFCYDDIWLVDGENELYETVYEKDDSEDEGVKEVKVKTGVFADKDTPGAVATPGPYSIRYEELLCFVVSGELQNERIKYSALEARIAALENA